jgi:hypothetical protein
MKNIYNFAVKIRLIKTFLTSGGIYLDLITMLCGFAGFKKSSSSSVFYYSEISIRIIRYLPVDTAYGGLDVNKTIFSSSCLL